jgi:hypothetical protein
MHHHLAVWQGDFVHESTLHEVGEDEDSEEEKAGGEDHSGKHSGGQIA